MEKVIKLFLESEISDQKAYDNIMSFILSLNVRSGEYKSDRFVIKKMDHLNFIIFEEYVSSKKDKRKIFNSFSVNDHQLIHLINEYATVQGFNLKTGRAHD